MILYYFSIFNLHVSKFSNLHDLAHVLVHVNVVYKYATHRFITPVSAKSVHWHIHFLLVPLGMIQVPDLFCMRIVSLHFPYIINVFRKSEC